MNDLKIENYTLSELAYKKVKSLILNNILKPGDKINQEKVAGELGISKIPLIQALTLLTRESLLEKLPRKGFFVKKYSRKELNEIFELRAILEMEGVYSLVENMDPAVENKLKKFLNDFEYYYKEKKTKEHYELDTQFHYFIVNSTKNDLIIRLNETHNILLLCFTKGWVLDWDTSIEQHREIINLVLDKNMSGAGLAIRRHIFSIREAYTRK